MRMVLKVLWLKPTKGMISVGRNLIAEELRKYGFKVDVVECSGFGVIKALIHALTSDYKVVIGTTHLGLALGGFIKLLKKVKFVADFVDRYSLLYETYSKFLYPLLALIVLLEKIALKIADAIIVVPLEDYNDLAKRRSLVYKNNLCISLENFIHVDDTRLSKARELLEEIGVDLKKPKIIYVGGFSKIYNLDILVKVMEILSEFQLILVGGGEMEDRLKKIKEELNLSNVFFLGYQPNYLIPGFLRNCDIGVSLCNIPRQLKIYEYLASGLNVVVSNDVLNSKEFEFRGFCIGVDLNIQEITNGLKKAITMNTKKNYKIVFKKLQNYSCRNVSKVYLMIIRMLKGT